MDNDRSRKIIILIGDGMADLPIEKLGGKTPIEFSHTPCMDYIASHGICGLAQTVPAGMDPGSDTANLSIFGYDPSECYTGRAPLEALNMNIPMGERDAAFRCNIVLTAGGVMEDFSADHIESGFSKMVIDEMRAAVKIPGIEFYPGVSYRNIMIWRDYPYAKITSATPPHDIHGKKISEYLPRGDGSDIIKKIMEDSRGIIRNSEKIKNAWKDLKGEPESVWIWGGGTKPKVKTLRELYGLEGYTISAVDLIHGIGRAAGLQPMHVAGATGYLDTNYEGKVEGLAKALETSNYVFLHVEAPDESGHEGNLDHKLQAIADFDKRVVGPVLELVSSYDNYSLLVMPDHPTPVSIRTHSSDPIPFCMMRTGGFTGAEKFGRAAAYGENSAKNTSLLIKKAHRLVELMINGSVDGVLQ